MARRYTSLGSPVASEATVNATGLAFPHPPRPRVALADDGQFVVVWSTPFNSGSDPDVGIEVRRWTPAGGFGAQQQVNTTEALDQDRPDVTLLAGAGFVATWTDDDETQPTSGVRARRFGADSASSADVAAEPWGSVAAVWSVADGDADGDGNGIQARGFDRQATPHAAEAVANTTTAGDQSGPEVAVDEDGDRFLVWHSDAHGTDTDGAVVGRRIPGPVAAAWRLDEGSGSSISDTAGAEANDGNVNGAMRVAGRFGGALAFDGVDDYALVLPTADLALAGDSEALPGPVRTSPAQQPAIGRNGSGVAVARYHFLGAVDELRVWRRVPSAAEIALLARPPRLRDGFESGNTAAWHDEEPAP